MAIADELARFEQQLGLLMTRYEQYFSGTEKREPLQLLDEVVTLSLTLSSSPISNTMLKHRYNMLAARLSTYREHWSRTARLIEEGRHRRGRHAAGTRKERRRAGSPEKREISGAGENGSYGEDFENIYRQYIDARRICSLSTEIISRETLFSSMEEKKPLLSKQLGSDNLVYRVVIQDGSPRIKASVRKK